MKRSPLFWKDRLIKSNGDVTSLGEVISDVAELQKITREDLSDVLNVTASNKKLTAMKYGKVVSIFLILDNITLATGMASIGLIPEKYKPSTSIIQTVHSRNTGAWAAAEYYPAVLSVTEGGTLYIRTGANYSNIKYIECCITYLVEN